MKRKVIELFRIPLFSAGREAGCGKEDRERISGWLW
jgi:hypothetical protein